MPELHGRDVETDDARALVPECDRPLRRTASELQYRPARYVAEDVQLRFGYSVRAPREGRLRELVAVRVLIVVGVGVPERSVVTNVRVAHAVGENPASVIGSLCSTRRPFATIETS